VATESTWPPRDATTGMIRQVSIAWGRRRVRDAFVLVAFVGFTALWSHGLLLHLGNAVLLGPNDETNSIRQYWAAQYLGKTPFTLHRDTLNGAPEGLFVSTAVQIANAVIPGTIWLLHYVMGLTAAENTFLLSGFALTGFAVYLLLERLGLEPIAAIYAGYVVAFNPWMIERAYAGHHGYMHAWVFPALIAALLWVHRTHRVVAAAAAGAALTLTFYTSSYYGLLAALVFGVFFVVDLFQQPTWRDRLWSFTLLDVAAVSAIVVFLPALIAWRTDQQAVASGVTNPVSQLQSGGASLSSYVLPWWRNPALGEITTHFYPRYATQDHWSANGMNTLYVGWSLIALAAVGAVLILRRDPETTRTATLRFFFVCSLILVPAAFVCSLKRKVPILGIDVPMPAYFVGQVTTFWRIFARFGVLVTFGCAMLAALALTVALRRFRRGWLIAVVAFALIAVEYTAGLPPVYRLSTPPWATWIRAQPAGIVANYPMPTDKPQAANLLVETFFQQIHSQHPQFMLFGSGTGGTREDAIRLLTRYVTDPLTPGILKAEGVKYVLLHDDVYRADGEQPPGIPAGFHLVAKLPGDVRAVAIDGTVQAADLPVVLAQNAAQIALVQGLPTPSLEMSATVSNSARVVHGESTFDLSWSDPRLKRVQVLIHARSHSAPTSLELLAPDSRVIARSAIGVTDTPVSWGPIDLAGSSARFELRTAPATTAELSSVQLQPLADVTTSIRDVR
jgi:hypothetical protein